MTHEITHFGCDTVFNNYSLPYPKKQQGKNQSDFRQIVKEIEDMVKNNSSHSFHPELIAGLDYDQDKLEKAKTLKEKEKEKALINEVQETREKEIIARALQVMVLAVLENKPNDTGFNLQAHLKNKLGVKLYNFVIEKFLPACKTHFNKLAKQYNLELQACETLQNSFPKNTNDIEEIKLTP